MRRYLAIFLLLAVPIGCAQFGAPAPETPRERLAAAEATYQAVVASIRDMALAEAIEERHVDSLEASIMAARTALDSWHANPDLDDSAGAALAAIRALQTIAARIAQEARE